MALERSRLERSRPERFLPASSAGLRDGAEAIAASTSARVISADAISGDVRSTCCIISFEAPGMGEARTNSTTPADGRQVRVVCRALCAGVWWRPRSYDPMAVAGKLSEPRRLRQYLRRKL